MYSLSFSLSFSSLSSSIAVEELFLFGRVVLSFPGGLDHRKEIFGNGSSCVFGELLISFYISCRGGNQLDDAAFILYGGHA